MCHITKITSVWRALVDLSKSSVCICSLRISGFAGLTALHLSNPAICICRQVISTLLLEQRWISPKKSFVFSKSNHLHFHSGDIHICQSLLFSSLLINQNPHLTASASLRVIHVPRVHGNNIFFQIAPLSCTWTKLMECTRYFQYNCYRHVFWGGCI